MIYSLDLFKCRRLPYLGPHGRLRQYRTGLVVRLPIQSRHIGFLKLEGEPLLSLGDRSGAMPFPTDSQRFLEPMSL